MDLPDSMIVVDTVVTSISLLCVLLRFYTRSVIVKRLWTEDILIGIVEVLAIGWLVTISFGYKQGYGRHLHEILDRPDGDEVLIRTDQV
ncbi:hypothetical protein B0A52_09415 [Exophiala mesophila]|uniref:Uncharacterized protein n=1 Tax=Exophiala mesophila TaxID=212818 RepID=A0A438MUE6_EXOME|nr:hypothetical protein B0A52_09415 [Exophiala mesophila]